MCFGIEAQFDTCCTQEQGPCSYPYVPQLKERWFIRADASQPQLLPSLVGRFWMRTTPHIPRPGETFDVVVTRSGLPGSMNMDMPWIRIDGSKVPWTSVDAPSERFVATVETPVDAESVEVQLLYDTKVLLSKDVIVGYNFDPNRLDVTGYPTEHSALSSQWMLTLALSPDVRQANFLPQTVTVRDQTGAEIPSNTAVISNNRVDLNLSWPKVPEGSLVSVYDGERKLVGPIPAMRAPTVDETLVLTDSVRGFLVRTSVVEGGDTNRVFFTLIDSQGFPLPPRPEIIRAEVDGANIIDGPIVLDKRPWEITIGLRSTDGVGDVALRVYDLSDRLLGTWNYRKRASENLLCAAGMTTAELGHASIPAGVGATTTLRVAPRNEFAEMLGMDARIELRLPDIIEADALSVSVGGFYETVIRTGDYGGEALIDVVCNDDVVLSLPLQVVGPPPPETTTPEPTADTYEEVAPDAGSSDAGAGPKVPRDEGCGAASPTSTPLLGGLLLLLIALRTCRRERNVAGEKHRA